jgi:hypothetical protein
MEQLHKGSVTISGLYFTEALEHYTRVRSLEFPRLNFSGLAAVKLHNLARHTEIASARYVEVFENRQS